MSVCVLIWISPWFQTYLVSAARDLIDRFSLRLIFLYLFEFCLFSSRSLVCKQKDSFSSRCDSGVCLLPKLHTIGAIDTKSILLHENVWDCDVLEAEGAARLKAVVYEIHQACAQINL